VLGGFVDLTSLDGILELSQHTDQLVRRNGTTSFGRKRRS
jgi:hypothetical protein